MARAVGRVAGTAASVAFVCLCVCVLRFSLERGRPTPFWWKRGVTTNGTPDLSRAADGIHPPLLHASRCPPPPRRGGIFDSRASTAARPFSRRRRRLASCRWRPPQPPSMGCARCPCRPHTCRCCRRVAATAVRLCPPLLLPSVWSSSAGALRKREPIAASCRSVESQGAAPLPQRGLCVLPPRRRCGRTPCGAPRPVAVKGGGVRGRALPLAGRASDAPPAVGCTHREGGCSR